MRALRGLVGVAEMYKRALFGWSAFAFTATALVSSPAAACGWGGCDDYYGYYGAPAFAYYSPPVRIYSYPPPVYYSAPYYAPPIYYAVPAPVYYAPPVYAYGGYYGVGRSFVPAPHYDRYYGVQRDYVTAGYRQRLHVRGPVRGWRSDHVRVGYHGGRVGRVARRW